MTSQPLRRIKLRAYRAILWLILAGCCIFMLFAVTGCQSLLVSKDTAAIRQQLVDDARSDMDKARSEFLVFAQAQLTAETSAGIATIDAAYLKTQTYIMTTPSSDMDKEVALKAALDRYVSNRDKLFANLTAKANSFALIAAKMQSGSLALDSIARMDTNRETLEKNLLRNVVLNDVVPLIQARVIPGTTPTVGATNVNSIAK